MTLFLAAEIFWGSQLRKLNFYSFVLGIDYVLFSVTISGWYFGKTGGLLGIYDNEPSNDWMTPERDVVDDIKTFATSWQVVIIIQS